MASDVDLTLGEWILLTGLALGTDEKEYQVGAVESMTRVCNYIIDVLVLFEKAEISNPDPDAVAKVQELLTDIKYKL